MEVEDNLELRNATKRQEDVCDKLVAGDHDQDEKANSPTESEGKHSSSTSSATEGEQEGDQSKVTDDGMDENQEKMDDDKNEDDCKQEIVYTANARDTLNSIAAKYDTTPSRYVLCCLNMLSPTKRDLGSYTFRRKIRKDFNPHFARFGFRRKWGAQKCLSYQLFFLILHSGLHNTTDSHLASSSTE